MDVHLHMEWQNSLIFPYTVKYKGNSFTSVKVIWKPESLNKNNTWGITAGQVNCEQNTSFQHLQCVTAALFLLEFIFLSKATISDHSES